MGVPCRNVVQTVAAAKRALAPSHGTRRGCMRIDSPTLPASSSRAARVMPQPGHARWKNAAMGHRAAPMAGGRALTAQTAATPRARRVNARRDAFAPLGGEAAWAGTAPADTGAG